MHGFENPAVFCEKKILFISIQAGCRIIIETSGTPAPAVNRMANRVKTVIARQKNLRANRWTFFQ